MTTNKQHLPKTSRPPFRKTFIRSQVVSIVATTVDFVTAISLHYFLSVYYVTATSIGSVCGAVTSFNLGRNWAFQNRHGKIGHQALRFMVINLFSIFANTTGVYFFKEYFLLSFVVSRVIVSFLVGVCFNFFMNRYFVFR